MAAPKTAAEPKKTTIVVGDGGLEFVTPTGRPLMSLRLFQGEAVLTLISPGGEPSVTVRAGASGGNVSAGNPANDSRAVLQGRAAGSLVAATDAGDAISSKIMSLPTGGQVAVYRDGKEAAALFAHREGGSAMVFDGEGRPRVEARASEGEGQLAVFGRNGLTFAVPVQSLPGFGKGQKEG